MKVYTQEEFNNLPTDEFGVVFCPTGDYTQIKYFPKKCKFEGGSIFGFDSTFAESCYFGEQCVFDDCCDFSSGCVFESRCKFGECCNFNFVCHFNQECTFGEWCVFSARCFFDKQCVFGEKCEFGDRCYFTEGCMIDNNKPIKDYLKFDIQGFLNHCVYFYLLTDDSIYVRFEDYGKDISVFKKELVELYNDSKENEAYLKMIDFAQWYFKTKEE